MLNKIFNKKALLTALTIVSAMSYAPMGNAALASYSQNFESLNAISSTALSDSGFVVYANTYTDQGLSNRKQYRNKYSSNDYRGYAQVVSGEVT